MNAGLIKYEAARQAVIECASVDEAKDIRDKALALEAYAKQAKDEEMYQKFMEIRLRAERKAGELLKEMPKAKAGRPVELIGTQEVPINNKTPTLFDIGITKNQSSYWQKLADIQEDEFNEVFQEALEKEVPVKQVIRDKVKKQIRAQKIERVIEISKSNAPLSGIPKCAVIYCDPPWEYEHVKTENRAIENHYPTMKLQDIKSMDINSISLDDSVMFMWATSPKLSEAMDVIKSWGFNYRTCAVWDKGIIGMGYYFRQQHELLLVATKGSLPVPEPANRPSSVFNEKRGEHSAKPKAFYSIIESMYPELPKVELFCRSPVDGWFVWGNQSDA